MIFLSFGSMLFQKEYKSCSIKIVIGSKDKYQTAQYFLEEARKFHDREMGIDGYTYSYSLKEGQYSAIIERWINTLTDEIEIKSSEIQKTYGVKAFPSNPCEVNYVLETIGEYILFTWSTAE